MLVDIFDKRQLDTYFWATLYHNPQEMIFDRYLQSMFQKIIYMISVKNICIFWEKKVMPGSFESYWMDSDDTDGTDGKLSPLTQ